MKKKSDLPEWLLEKIEQQVPAQVAMARSIEKQRGKKMSRDEFAKACLFTGAMMAAAWEEERSSSACRT